VRFGRVFARLDDACFVVEHYRLHAVSRPSFIRIRATCVFTVVSERKSSFAISAFDLACTEGDREPVRQSSTPLRWRCSSGRARSE
jgi:hypothetical protein